MLASLVFDVILSISAEQRKKAVSVVCTDTRVEIPAIVEMVEGTLDRMRKCSQQHALNIEASLLKPTIEESFWVNIIIGRGCRSGLLPNIGRANESPNHFLIIFIDIRDLKV